MRPLTLVVAPSGSGKNYILDAFSLRPLISNTTRPRRPKEVDGVDHTFVNKTAYKKTCEIIDLVMSSPDLQHQATIMANNNISACVKFNGNYYWATITDIMNEDFDAYVIDPFAATALLTLNSNAKQYSTKNARSISSGPYKGLFRPMNVVWLETAWYKRIWNMIKREIPSKVSGPMVVVYLIKNWRLVRKVFDRFYHDLSAFNYEKFCVAAKDLLPNTAKITLIKL